MNSFVLDLHEVDQTKINIVGGKAANLGELLKIEEILVPQGFCITTDAYKDIIVSTPAINELIEQLTGLTLNDRNQIIKLSSEVRTAIESVVIPKHIAKNITQYLLKSDKNIAYAIRSSATAEDLPTASFAGQQDTFLNIIGEKEILKHISKCWASLFTERAVIYRIQNGFDHRKIQLAVIVQQMIFPQSSGIMFTADPVTSNRKIISVDASFGLGEALVSGIVNADNYKVNNGQIINRKIPDKKLAIYADKDGGTVQQELSSEMQSNQALTDEQVLQFEFIGRKIEQHFGCPQDIEWCLADDTFYIVQSRPITTLFPIPKVSDEKNHVYISVGHQQMMTDAMKPLGISFWQLTASWSMDTAGGRLFVDVTGMLSSSTGRENILNVLGRNDPLMKDALTNIIERENFICLLDDDQQNLYNKRRPIADYNTLKEFDVSVVNQFIESGQAAIKQLKQDVKIKSGTELIDFIIEDIQRLKQRVTNPESFAVFMTAMNASTWINEKMNDWLGEKNVADAISQSVPNNITSEMGLALLDVADVVRNYPEVITYLQHTKDDNFLNELYQINGGLEVYDAVETYLDKYGMRCAGEIDITRPRWSEKPMMLLPVILSNIYNLKPGASKQKFEQGLQEAFNKEHDLLKRLRHLPDGEEKAQQTKRMINLVRNLIGYREYPKYEIVSRYSIYKQALLKEAALLMQSGVIHDKEDIYYLTINELKDVISASKANYTIIDQRKEEFKQHEKLKPPRVITSDGEIISGAYKRTDFPANAIIGLPVSSGVVEGRARIILNMQDADPEEGDILVTTFTDPSWTPLFVSIKGLVTEVGGLMTHGAVIAREYGLPAIVGVENATSIIKDGQRIRLNGTDGLIEIL